MNQTKLEISVGAFVIVGLAAIAYLALKIGAGLLVGADTYLISARFGNSSGLSVGGKVSISGVTIGSVESVTLDPADFGAIVTMRVRADIKLPVDTAVAVRANGLLGDRYLQLRPGSAQEIAAPGGMLLRTESTSDLESAIRQFTGGGAPDLSNQDTYVVRARFGNVAGLTPGARVTISGVAVGVVEEITLHPDDFSALVALRLRSDLELPLDTIVSVRSSGLIGGKFLAVQLGADEEMVAAGGILTETQSSIDLESLISRFAFGSVKDKEAAPTTPEP
jgi:phospholipid/cholesterol/gamma-HCH transport system substrate-binding protein